MSEPNQTPDTATVAKAMQRAWNDFVGDTGCYPDCFERKDGKLYADFTVGNFALMVANALADTAVCSVKDCIGRVYISDRDGGYCRTHWDEMEAAKHAEEKRATEEAGGPWPQLCPRRTEDRGTTEGLPDTWSIREQMHNGLVARHCNYCGSLHPDDFMQRVKDGWKVGATDKNYKAYLGSPEPDGGSMETKFYFQHLSDEQRREFVQLYNEHRINMGGHPFYRLPFFMKAAG